MGLADLVFEPHPNFEYQYNFWDVQMILKQLFDITLFEHGKFLWACRIDFRKSFVHPHFW